MIGETTEDAHERFKRKSAEPIVVKPMVNRKMTDSRFAGTQGHGRGPAGDCISCGDVWPCRSGPLWG